MVINFGAGPAKLPEDVLLKIEKQVKDYENTGVSIMEMSHRGSQYLKIHNESIQMITDLLELPKNYKVLLTQGGGQGMFSAICMNLMGKTGKADYIVTGQWSAKAAKEAEKYGRVNMVVPKPAKYINIPDQKTWNLDPEASYVFYCDNETIDGVEFNFIPDTKGVPLVVDMSSNMMTRKFDITKFGLVFACAQKNIGTAGITVVIIREDLIGQPMKITPSIMDFKVTYDNNSVYNTPPTFVVYVMGRVLNWIKENGGIEKMEQISLTKSKLIYDIIRKTNGFYQCPVEEQYRSRMNIPFSIKTDKTDGGNSSNEELEKKFLNEAEKLGLVQLKGHRLVGGIRASIYNAITIEEVEILVKFMEKFYQEHRLC